MGSGVGRGVSITHLPQPPPQHCDTLDVVPTAPSTTSVSLPESNPSVAADPISESSTISAESLKSGPPNQLVLPTAAMISARHEAYLERKKARKELRSAKGTKNGGGPTPFLSNLPEVDSDIDYRFSMVVMGPLSVAVVRTTCDSPEARAYLMSGQMGAIPSNLDAVFDSERSRLGAMTPSSTESTLERCLCTVPYRSESTEASKCFHPQKRPRLAKLIFKTTNFADDVPVCRTRFEALSAALVFVLTVDPSAEEESFIEQLFRYEQATDEMRVQPRRLRTARAVLLVSRAPATKEVIEGEWRVSLDEFETVHGGLWKFGPVHYLDAGACYGALCTIASSRLLRAQLSDGCESDGSHCSDLPPVWEAERVENDSVGDNSVDDALPSENPTIQRSFRHAWLSDIHRGAA
mmetsp:Transcript_60819/g.170046  ORF Transcript_60819/g.170046 Transcript_60819/m.170046 type:complete len:408 (+) Transcript_60819:38-1261(+)